MPWTLVVSLLAFFATSPLVFAQTTTATCMSSFDWASNSLKQSPCLVASYLLGTCDTAAHDVPALPEGNHYLGPTSTTVNPCECNTVVYSLISACGECQNRTISGWGTWSANCRHVDIGSFPNEIPLGTRVPGWAYLDVKASDQFDVNLAKANANATESAAPQPSPTPSSTAPPRSSAKPTRTTSVVAHSSSPVYSIVSTSSAAPSPTTSASSDSSNSETEVRDTRIDKIIGGTIGGVFALALISGLGMYFYRRQQGRVDGITQLESPTMEHASNAPASFNHPTSPNIVVHSDDTQAPTYPAGTAA